LKGFEDDEEMGTLKCGNKHFILPSFHFYVSMQMLLSIGFPKHHVPFAKSDDMAAAPFI
jgi:hypothetical protein